MLAFFVSSFCLYLALRQCYGQCDDELQCASTIISSSSDITCYGYRSCQLSFLNTDDGNIYCDGMYSCFGSQPNSTSSSFHIYCRGLLSCQSAVSRAENGNIYCHGEKSCLDSAIYQLSTSSTLYCHGFGSYMNSTIFLSNDIIQHMVAQLSAQQAAYDFCFQRHKLDMVHG